MVGAILFFPVVKGLIADAMVPAKNGSAVTIYPFILK